MANDDQNGQSGDGNDPNASASQHFRRLEQSRDTWKDAASKWRSIALQGVVHQAGFDPGDGVTKLLLEKFDSDDLDPSDLSPDDFTSFASEYGVEPTPTTPSNDGGQGGPDPDLQAQIDAQQQGTQPGTPQPGTQPPAPNQPAVPPQMQPQPTPAEQFQQMQQTGDQLAAAAAASGANQPASLQQKVADAEAKGDFNTAFAGKMQLAAQAGPQGQPGGGGADLPQRTPPTAHQQ